MIATIDDIPVFNATIDEDCGIIRVSLVDDPAVSKNFQVFKANAQPMLYAVQDEDKHLVRGVIMRADYPIYRRDKKLGEYYVVYKPDVIRQMAEKYLKEDRANNVNIMHKEGSDVEGVNMVQWFIKGAGVAIDGFDDIADGSLFAEYHVTNEDVWAEIKAGTYKGFSIEVYFNLEPEQNENYVQDVIDKWGEYFSKIKNMANFKKFATALAKMLAKFASITTDKGVLVWDTEDDLKAGDSVYVQGEDGTRVKAEDGDYKTDDGKVIKVVDGKVAEIVDDEAEVKLGSVDTDKGRLYAEGDDDLKAGDAVFADEKKETPAADGDYVTADGKTIVVKDGKVSEIKDPKAEVATAATQKFEGEDLSARLDKLERIVKLIINFCYLPLLDGDGNFLFSKEKPKDTLCGRLDALETAMDNVATILEKMGKAPKAAPATEEFKTTTEQKIDNPRTASLMRILNAGR
jgi:hypothetical protein